MEEGDVGEAGLRQCFAELATREAEFRHVHFNALRNISRQTFDFDLTNDQFENAAFRFHATGFAFDRDFVLKTSLTLLGQGARYEVSKFRKQGVREDVEKRWDDIAQAIQDVLDFVRSEDQEDHVQRVVNLGQSAKIHCRGRG